MDNHTWSFQEKYTLKLFQQTLNTNGFIDSFLYYKLQSHYTHNKVQEVIKHCKNKNSTSSDILNIMHLRRIGPLVHDTHTKT